MTEKELFVKMLKRAGVPFQQEGNVITMTASGSNVDGPLKGYYGFVNDWEFDIHGNLSEVGIWE